MTMSRDWFHDNLNARQAEQRLLSAQRDGSFLVRSSSTIPGTFTISVRHAGSIHHIKVLNDGDTFSLLGSLDPFPTLGALLRYYTNKPDSIKDKTGLIIPLLHPINSTRPTSERWFHGGLDSKEAERVLLDKGEIGSFLVRESRTEPGQYVLAVKCKHLVHQMIIRHDSGTFDMSGAIFKMSSLSALIEHLVKHPASLRDATNQSPIVLKEPYNGTCFTASYIRQRIDVLEKVTTGGVSGFQDEFLKLTNEDGFYSVKVGAKENNNIKNRYRNILPYDHSRVRLRTCDTATSICDDIFIEDGTKTLRGPSTKCDYHIPTSPPDEDYINANYIDAGLESSHVRYIATQGPTDQTASDFWDMIYQEKSVVILMLTNEEEDGKQKCIKYWPSVNDTLQYTNFYVENTEETQGPHYTRRCLKISPVERELKKGPLLVQQFHYTEWPDHDVPAAPAQILSMLVEVHQLLNESQSWLQEAAPPDVSPATSPVVVHCSAGIGRTGTVICIDVLVRLLGEVGVGAVVDVQKVCKILRTQRAGMVQSVEQYKLIYLCLDCYIDAMKKN